MSSPAQVLAVARKELGTKESPAGSNRVKYSSWYGMTGPWCAMYVSWVAHHAGATKVIPKHAYTPSGADWFRARKAFHTKGPRVGDIVYFKWPSVGRICHVGIVETVHSDGSVTCIEGNTDTAGGRTGGQVMRQRRRSGIAGYGRPAYTNQPTTGGGDDMPTPAQVAETTWKCGITNSITGKPAQAQVFLQTVNKSTHGMLAMIRAMADAMGPDVRRAVDKAYIDATQGK